MAETNAARLHWAAIERCDDASAPRLVRCAQGYCLVLLDCSVGAVGLLYLAVLAWVLGVQPRMGQWQTRGLSPAASSAQLDRFMLGTPGAAAGVGRPGRRCAAPPVLVGSTAAQWLPLCVLALVAATDFAAQAALPALAQLRWPFRIPSGVLSFLDSAVGISSEARGLDLALRLLRPAALLAGVALYRWLYCLGTLHRQLQQEGMDEGARERAR